MRRMVAIPLALLVLTLTACAANAAPPAYTADPGGARVARDVVYGQGLVGHDAGARPRDLKMDVWMPAGEAAAPRAAVVLAFGGAFHRGSKGEGSYTEDGAQDSSMADYCRVFVREGYACFSIDYRLTPEDPSLSAPPPAESLFPEAMLDAPGATSRIDFVRTQMGLPPLDAETRKQYWRASLAAAEDMATAVAHIQAHAAAYDIDASRVAVGGFSSGAITAINTAYGARAPVRAVFALSGAVLGYDLSKTAQAGDPPLLLLAGQNDLPGILNGGRYAVATLGAAGVPVETAWVPGFGHFYPMGAVSLGADLSREPVEARILTFLTATIGPP